MSKLITLEKTNYLSNSLLGTHKEKILIELNTNNPPTVKQNTSFNLIDGSGFSRFISEPSADQTFTWGSGNFPVISDGTWYLYCDGNNETKNLYKKSTGTYGASKNAISYSVEKNGWYNSDGKVIGQFIVSSSVVSDLIIFDKNFIYAGSSPSIIPGNIGQIWIDTSTNQIFQSVGISSTTDWVETSTNVKINSLSSGTYQILNADKYTNIDFTHSSTTALLQSNLPEASSNNGRIIRFSNIGTDNGLSYINKYTGDGANILFKNELKSIIKLFMRGDYILLRSNGTYWIVEDYDINIKIGWQNRSDWTNVHIGNSVTYDTKSAAVDWTGKKFNGDDDTSTNTCVCLYDSGGVGTSGELYFYNISGSKGWFQNDLTLTTSDGSGTALVNEASGDSKDVDKNLYHGFDINADSIICNKYENNTASYTGAKEISISIFNISNYGIQLYQIDTNSLKIQSADTGAQYLNDSGVGVNFSDEYYNIKIII